MAYDVRLLIIAVLSALDAPKRSDELLATLIEDDGDLRELTADDLAVALTNLVDLGIVGSQPGEPVSETTYSLLTSIQQLSPLLKTLGQKPWVRLANWKEKLGIVEDETSRVSYRPQMRAVRATYQPQTGTSQDYYVQEVLFVTDRRMDVHEGANVIYSSERANNEALTYGRAEVSIPNTHSLGNLESPSFLRLEIQADPTKHVALLRTSSMSQNDFFQSALSGMKGPSAKLLVFVHGYNVTFEDAIRRTAQLAFDLQYEGIPIAYSWPSRGELLDYVFDSNNAEWSQPHFQSFLSRLGADVEARRIDIVAHSMGNRLVARSLANLTKDPNFAKFASVVLAAPDIDREIFLQLAGALATGAARVTLYVSSHDRALKVSKSLNGLPRAGDVGDDIVVVDGIQTVDVSALAADFTGHGYFGGDVNVVSDLYYLFLGHAPRRFRLRPATSQ